VNGDSGGNGGTASLSQLAGITLGVGTAVVNQSLPLDPSGVVYDSVTRAPIAGATVELLYGGAAINPAWVAGGSATQSSAAGGHYAFFLLPAALPGTYSLRVSMPPGYRPTPSATIAPSIAPAGFAGGSVGTAGAPPVGAVTTYYLSFPLPTSDITNNNIPLDAAAVAAAPIPTLSEWGMIVLAMMLAASAWQSRRRPRRAR